MIIQREKPAVTIVHTLPGRVRARLSHAPHDVARLRGEILEHEGLHSIDYQPRTRSVLVRFDPRLVGEQEIALRIAMQLSLDRGAHPVRLLTRQESRVLEDSAVVAAIALGAAQLLRWLAPGINGSSRLFDWTAGATTAWAVGDHAIKEMRERGYFDPEVLSLAYLVSAAPRGNLLKAATVTWLTSFGRHLVAPVPSGVEVRPLILTDPTTGQQRCELQIGPDPDAPERVQVLGAIQGLLKYALTGGVPGARQLWDELRDVSQVHGEVLEGFGPMRGGIPMRFTDGNGGNRSWQ
jgi:hypothetical protein